jgi:hypothetical protein
MTPEELEELATLVSYKIQEGILKMSPEMLRYTKGYAGYQYQNYVTPGNTPLSLRLRILGNGGLELEFIGINGVALNRLVLSP